MYQTGGLFHPLSSQRIYQSNQGLRLSAKAFGLPKGAAICLKSRRLSSDSKVDRTQKPSCFLPRGGPAARSPPAQHPTLSPFSRLDLAALVRPPFPKQHPLPLWISADRPRQTPGPCLSEPIGCPSLRKVGPRSLTSGLALTGILTVAIGLLWSLLLSDRQACFTLMAISAAEFPGLDRGSARLQRAVTELAEGPVPVGRPACNSLIGSSCSTQPAEEAAAI